jgi:hypothetical protein
MSDPFGNLLLYTDGVTVFNRNHQAMPNGTGLLGNTSTTQSSLIIPFPDNDSLYYVMTLAQGAELDGLSYSLVNMNLDNGLGDVTGVKNVKLVGPVTERMTAVRHSNGSDIWAIVRGWRNANFYAYRFTCAGLDPNPVISTVAPVIDSGAMTLQFFNSSGQMKVSVDGTKIALGHLETLSIYVYNFDAATGVVTPRVRLQGPGPVGLVPTGPFSGIYGLEFSPNSRYLYVNAIFGGSALSQFDLEAGTGSATDILNSQVIIGAGQGPLQLGPDGRIYLGRQRNSFLDVIRVPNAAGFAAQFTSFGVSLGGRTNSLVGSIPNFILDYFNPEPNRIIGDRVVCAPDTVSYRVPVLSCSDSLVWELLGEGQVVTEAGNAIQIAFPALSAPTDTLIATRFGSCGVVVDTAFITIVPNSSFLVDLGPDTALCGNASISLGAGVLAQGYLWSTGEKFVPIVVDSPGVYILEAGAASGCTARDTIVVFPDLALGPLDLGPDTCICNGDVVILDPGLQGVSFTWQDGSIDPTFTAEVPGTYYVTVSDSCGNTPSDTVQVSFCVNQTSVNLGNDTLLANIDSLDAGTGGAFAPSSPCTYLWSTGDTTRKIAVTTAGTYSVVVNCGGCQAIDDVNIFENALGTTLLLFQGQDNQDGTREIRWIPSNPNGWEKYILDHGTTLNNFEAIATRRGGEARYATKVTIPGTSQKDYYRLRMYDERGIETLSSILIMESELNEWLRISPNPSQGAFYVRGNLDTQTICVRDFTGKICYENKVEFTQTPTLISADQLAAGVYMVEITGDQGTRFVEKWVSVDR